jgi:hypothetical protein
MFDSRFVQIGYVSRKAAHNVRYQTLRALLNNPIVGFTLVKPAKVSRYLLDVLGPFASLRVKSVKKGEMQYGRQE